MAEEQVVGIVLVQILSLIAMLMPFNGPSTTLNVWSGIYANELTAASRSRRDGGRDEYRPLRRACLIAMHGRGVERRRASMASGREE